MLHNEKVKVSISLLLNFPSVATSKMKIIFKPCSKGMFIDAENQFTATKSLELSIAATAAAMIASVFSRVKYGAP